MCVLKSLGHTFRRWHDFRNRVSMSNPTPAGPISLARSAAIVLATFCLVQRAAAQAYDPSHDPFVQRTTNMGEQMRQERAFGGSVFDRTDPFYFFGGTYSGRMRVPALPPALGEDLASRFVEVPGRVEVLRPKAALGGDGLDGSAAAEFTRETFYGPYAMLLDWHQVSGKQAKRVAAYQTARQELLEELKSNLAEVAGAAPATRQAALIELAARQDARLQALANEAEAIRGDLATSGTANEFRIGLWHRTAHFEESSDRFLWLFFSYYFDAGLSTDQRQLLPEIAYEQRPKSANPDKKPSGNATAYFYFLPAAARIRVPANLPSSLMEKIRACVKEKESLKNELRTEVLRDGEIYTRRRTNRFTALAERQAPRFAALYKLAEEIRVELAGFEYPAQPGKLALPADLTRRVGDFYARKVAVQRELIKRKVDAQQQFPTAYFAIERRGDGLAIKQDGVSPQNAASLTEFNASLARRYTALAQESETLRRDIQRYAGASSHHEARSVDQLATDFAKAYAAQENWNQYSTYYRAVLEPGLSPAQRQLLFHSAVTELEQNARMLHP